MLGEQVDDNCRRIAKEYGIENQLLQLSEECGELCVASLHFLRDTYRIDNLQEEIADVMVMIQQMIHYGVISEREIRRRAKQKTERQLYRIYGEEY